MTLNIDCDTIIDENNISTNESLFFKGCEDGNLELVNWLLHYDYRLIYNVKSHEISFCIACENNQIETAKALHSFLSNITIRDKYKEYLLSLCCEEDYYDLIVWLTYIFPSFITTMNEIKQYKLFFTACENFNFEIANYLGHMYPNIPIYLHNDQIFINACSQNLVTLASMLVDIRPQGYYIFIEEGRIVHYDVMQSVIITNHVCKNKIKTNLKIDECPICYDNISNVMTKCQHFFCIKCIEKHYEKNNVNCPYCRSENYEHDLSMIF